ncbi:MAG: type II toxin-antitoxin system RelB/DinJ family antitoxin [Candidatus Methanomethylophilaceae archaeon]|nr:type II toxin-antitoxin system RelB/DinJ family antitoxin [Candidatus Methanomethylophilaceae archaeon]
MDENLKNRFEKTCESMGISMSAALNMFVTAVVNEQRIPFEIKAKPYNPDEIWRSLERARMKVCEKYPDGMTLDEINEIIDEVRAKKD